MAVAAAGVGAWVAWGDEIKAFLRNTWGKLKQGLENLKTWVDEAFGVIKGWLDSIPTPILALLGPVGAVLVAFKHWNDIKEIAKGAYTGIKLWLSTKPLALFATIKGQVGKVIGFFKDMKDKIVGYAKATYEGIKNWMSDKVGAIFDGIKAKVDAVIGFFGGMKDKVVGNSIVPDMVDLVDSEFARMGTAMTDETSSAKDEVVTNLEDMTEAANDLNDANVAVATSTKAATEASPAYGVALAALAGQMGGAAGQAMNLVVAMRAHNEEQKLAAETGEATEKEFSKIEIAAATLGAAFSAIGEAVGGTAGAVLSELGTIASAFATGGVVAGIMAGIGSLIKGIKGLFGRGKKKREKAAAEERERLAAVAAAAEEAAERMRAAAEKAAAEIKAYWDGIYNGAVSGYDRAQAAGVAAYDEIFLAAIESGLGQEEAIAAATAAQEEAIAKTLAAEGDKFVRLAAFEAALEAIRSGNAAGAADAAVQAAADTRAAWETAMDAVTLADQAAGDSMIDTANKVAAIQERKANEAAAAQIAAAKRAAAAAASYVPPSYNTDPFDDLPGGFQDPEGFEGFQHGGHVGSGRPVLVGEAGPELFIPSQSGRIDPNVSSAGGGVNAKELAKAVSEALQNTRIEVDGRQLGRLTIRHQPLAVAELGGRR